MSPSAASTTVAVPTNTVDLTVCQCCGKPLRWYQQFSLKFGECTDRTCRRFAITLQLEDLAALTEAEVERFHKAARRSAAF